MADFITAAEQQIIAEIQAKYESLSDEAQHEVAVGVSWVHGHFWIVAACILVVGFGLGWIL